MRRAGSPAIIEIRLNRARMGTACVLAGRYEKRVKIIAFLLNVPDGYRLDIVLFA
jgi:hypothetical protein